MLKKDNEYPAMTEAQRAAFSKALAEEEAAKGENLAATRDCLPRLTRDCEQAVQVVAALREAREAAGISLTDVEQKSGIRKSVLSRLENSKAPNPTLGTLQRYAEAIGKTLSVQVH